MSSNNSSNNPNSVKDCAKQGCDLKLYSENLCDAILDILSVFER